MKSLVLLGLLVATDAQPSGKAIYDQHCARCHGEQGQGVKGEYGRALAGDWSVDKLARVIAETMPEDAPEKCAGPAADRVAEYIHQTFYSLEARARMAAPRVELARLTNRQYANTVADLIKQFTGQDPALPDQRGLRAAYYNSNNFKREAKVEDRLDPQVDFDFGLASPIPDKMGVEEFAMQWRGSVMADETGLYEFILKTSNGARLWVNDDREPLVDAWVSTGEMGEQRASLRLMGGRVYPLRLDFSKSKGKLKTNITASISLQWQPPHGVQQPIPARNLLPASVNPTLVMTTPFPPDDSSVGYERGVSISKAWDEAATYAAIETAHYVIEHLDRLAGAKPGNADRAAKLKSFCETFVAMAFRRPLTEAETRLWISSQFKDSIKPEESVKRVVLLALKSPRFLYLGLEGDQPDDFAVASRLSYGLWDSLPDQELTKLAEAGKLHTRDQITQQARRMLGDRRVRSKMQAFFQHWLQMNHVESLAKDDALYPEFSEEIIADLRASLRLFLEEVMWNEASDYRELLLADYLSLNGSLAKFYGAESNPTEDFSKIKVDPQQRSGVLTHPYLLAAFAYPKSTSPIHRGVFLTRNIVGRNLKPPPIAVAFKDAEFDPQMTMREKVAELTRDQACQTCHAVINPLGFSLEHFDAVGRFRTRENDRPIDAVSEYPTDDGATVRLTGARDVAEFAAASAHAQNGFIEQLFHHVVKQPLLAYGFDTVDELRESFVASGFNMQKLLVEIATRSALNGVPAQVAQSQ